MSGVAHLLAAVRRLHDTTPALQAYAPWPDDLSPQAVIPASVAVTHSIGVRSLPGTRQTAPVIRALRRAAPDLQWRQTYSEAEVGPAFLSDYGYVELFGPTGHFRSAKLRGYIGIWGPGLTYDWHDHEAEELYFTLAGSAVFSARDMPNAVLRPGDARAHTSGQPHLMLTLDQPFLAYALWRGAGMDGLPRMISS